MKDQRQDDKMTVLSVLELSVVVLSVLELSVVVLWVVVLMVLELWVVVLMMVVLLLWEEVNEERERVMMQAGSF